MFPDVTSPNMFPAQWVSEVGTQYAEIIIVWSGNLKYNKIKNA